MEKLIKVYDNIINTDLVDLVEDKALNQNHQGISYNFFNPINNFHPHYSDKRKEGFGFGNIFFKSGDVNKEDMLFFNQILYQACFSLNLIVEKIHNARIWLLTPEKENYISEPHTDMPDPHLACLYYVNDTDGDTIFFNQDKTTIIKKVAPKKGRVVIFDGSIWHSSSTPTKNVRSVINFNFSINKHNKI
jgi:hypothetical protein